MRSAAVVALALFVTPLTIAAANGTAANDSPRVLAGTGAWEAPDDLGNAFVSAIAVHPMNHRLMYAGVYGGGVYKSTNGGQTWQWARAPTGPFSKGLGRLSSTLILSAGATRGRGLFRPGSRSPADPMGLGVGTQRRRRRCPVAPRRRRLRCDSFPSEIRNWLVVEVRPRLLAGQFDRAEGADHGVRGLTSAAAQVR